MSDAMKEIFPNHSREMKIGDVVSVSFGLTHAGYWKFGSNGSFRVVEKTSDGKIRLKSPSGDTIPEPQNPPIGGTKKQMLDELRKLSSFKEVRIFRISAKKQEQPVKKKEEVKQRALVPVYRKVPIQKRARVAPPVPLILGVGVFSIAIIISTFTKSNG